MIASIMVLNSYDTSNEPQNQATLRNFLRPSVWRLSLLAHSSERLGRFAQHPEVEDSPNPPSPTSQLLLLVKGLNPEGPRTRMIGFQGPNTGI